MITIKLFMIHDAQIILDSDNNKFLIYFVHNNIIKTCVICLPWWKDCIFDPNLDIPNAA